MKPSTPRPLELLAPARDAATAIAAITHGADAVYMGAPAFGARAAAGNSIEDFETVVAAARPFGVKVYAALNTILYDSELEQAREIAASLARVGVDALIIQDPALLTMDLPPIELHASTQWNATTPQALATLSRAGLAQLVVPREFSLDDIRATAAAAPESRLEAFVHGALCVSYSGRCYAGQVLSGRSANRGACPQICRLPFTLTDSSGRPVTPPDGLPATRHWLSLADMNRIDHLAEMADAGISSFKIEGRLKSAAYVKNVTAAYRKALDRVIEASQGRYCRASYGRSDFSFRPDPVLSFNRGFTSYFLTGSDKKHITSWFTPKWTGRPVAKLIRASRGTLIVDDASSLANGDGLGWFDSERRFKGFRVNRVDSGNRIVAAPGAEVPSAPGTVLYRNNDVRFEAMMERSDTARRCIAVDITLRPAADGRPVIDLADERGLRVSVAAEKPCTDHAKTDQSTRRREELGRLGGTIYRAEKIEDLCGNIFIPASVLARLRRETFEALDLAADIARRTARRRPDLLTADALAGLHTRYTHNIANSKAAEFYTRHGAEIGEKALETAPQKGEVQVMTTRYCLRRELGACLRTPGAAKLPRGLYLDAPAGRLRLEFDCANCQMNIYTNSK